MGRIAQYVYVEPSDIARIQRRVVELPSQAHVCITMRGGATIVGTVTERPTAQLFKDAHGATGMNGQLRLDEAIARPAAEYLWLGDIERVERLVEN